MDQYVIEVLDHGYVRLVDTWGSDQAIIEDSRMRASANLRNWLGFLTLRQDKAAQWEIRMYANAVSDLVKLLFPRTHELYMESRY